MRCGNTVTVCVVIFIRHISKYAYIPTNTSMQEFLRSECLLAINFRLFVEGQMEQLSVCTTGILRTRVFPAQDVTLGQRDGQDV